ncbi:hypothetical protein BH18ACT11_BH18ACT11_24750 [soil metagenome]
MKRRTATLLAWGMCALALVLIVCVVAMTLLNGGDVFDVNFAIVGISSTVVGGAVASRRPANPVGWLFLAGTFGTATKVLAGEYAVYAILTNPGALPLPYAAAWLSNTMILIGPAISFILIPLYFPDGRPVSRRWAFVARASLGSLLLFTALYAFAPVEAVQRSGIQNPLGFEALRPFVKTFETVVLVWYIALILAAAGSLVVRFLRSAGEERQQLKWFTYAAAILPVWFLVNAPIQVAFPDLFSVLDSLFIAAVPIAAGIAILRYRLYDIDLIINRTIVYGVLSLLLGLIYFGTIALSQAALHALAGGESSLAVVASTLAIAALFNPLRQRVQDFIDRRFYRRKYDAAQTLEAFSARLREETELDRLGRDLVSVVHRTIQPEHASLWLKPPGESKQSESSSNSG